MITPTLHFSLTFALFFLFHSKKLTCSTGLLQVVDWLARNVKKVLERVDEKDPYVNECEKK